MTSRRSPLGPGHKQPFRSPRSGNGEVTRDEKNRHLKFQFHPRIGVTEGLLSGRQRWRANVRDEGPLPTNLSRSPTHEGLTTSAETRHSRTPSVARDILSARRASGKLKKDLFSICQGSRPTMESLAARQIRLLSWRPAVVEENANLTTGSAVDRIDQAFALPAILDNLMRAAVPLAVDEEGAQLH